MRYYTNNEILKMIYDKGFVITMDYLRSMDTFGRNRDFEYFIELKIKFHKTFDKYGKT
jgi:hypothetical protein